MISNERTNTVLAIHMERWPASLADGGWCSDGITEIMEKSKTYEK